MNAVMCRFNLTARTLLVAAGVLLAACGPSNSQVTPPPPGKQWTLVFRDEFDGDTLDRTKWTPRVWKQGLGDAEFIDSPHTLQVHDGSMHIRAWPKGRRYVSALVETQHKYYWHYGLFEARIKVAKGTGGTSAFWLMAADPLPEAYPFPLFGEIDIMEQLGSHPKKIWAALHYRDEPPGGEHETFDSLRPWADDYHIYSMLWSKEGFKYFVDGHLYKTITEWNATDPTVRESPFERNFFMIFDVHIGSDWGGGPNRHTRFPLDMAVDWVRVYSDEDPPPGRLTRY